MPHQEMRRELTCQMDSRFLEAEAVWLARAENTWEASSLLVAETVPADLMSST